MSAQAHYIRLLLLLLFSLTNSQTTKFTSLTINSTLDATPTTLIYIHELTLLVYDDNEQLSESSLSPTLSGFLHPTRLTDGSTETFSFPTGRSWQVSWDFSDAPQAIGGFIMLSTCDDSPSDFCTYEYELIAPSAANPFRGSFTIAADVYILHIQTIDDGCTSTSILADSVQSPSSTCSDTMPCPECLELLHVLEDDVDEDVWYVRSNSSSNCSCLPLEAKVPDNKVNFLRLYYPDAATGRQVGTLVGNEGADTLSLRLNYWAASDTQDANDLYEITCAPTYHVNQDVFMNRSMVNGISVEISFTLNLNVFATHNLTQQRQFEYGVDDFFLSLGEGRFHWYEVGSSLKNATGQSGTDSFDYIVETFISPVATTQLALELEEVFEQEEDTISSNLAFLVLSHFTDVYDELESGQFNVNYSISLDTDDIEQISNFEMNIRLVRDKNLYDSFCELGGLNSTGTSSKEEAFLEANEWFLPVVIPACVIILLAVVVAAFYCTRGGEKKEEWKKTVPMEDNDGSPRTNTSQTSMLPAPVTEPSGLEGGAATGGAVHNVTMRSSQLIGKSTKVLPGFGAGAGGAGGGAGPAGPGGVGVAVAPGTEGIPHRESRLVNPPHALSAEQKGKRLFQSTVIAVGGDGNGGTGPNGIIKNAAAGGVEMGGMDAMGGMGGMGGDYESDEELPLSLENEMEQIRINRKAIEFDFEKDLKLIKVIGVGSFGKVYKATWEDNPVAVKMFSSASVPLASANHGNGSLSAFNSYNYNQNNSRSGMSFAGSMGSGNTSNMRAIDSETQKELFAEIVIASQIPYHPNIVKIIGFCQNPLCVVMDYMRGGSVKRLVYGELTSYRKTPSLTEKLTILVKAASGLEHLHKQHVVHRDIAARNILLGSFGIEGITQETAVKVSDFGMARKMDTASGIEEDEVVGMETIQTTVTHVGPLKWMSPESIKNHNYSLKTDVYMWGITMWEIMYGQEPYPDADALNAAMKVVMQGERPEFLWPLPEELEDLMSQCWDKEAKKRPDFEEIRKTLKEIQDNEKQEAEDQREAELINNDENQTNAGYNDNGYDS